MKETKKETCKKKRSSQSSRNSRQIVALAGVILLVLLYVVTLIMAIMDSTQSAQWFRICLFATIALPLVLWIYSWMYGRLTGKSAIGDPDNGGSAQLPAGEGNIPSDLESLPAEDGRDAL